ncbi:hypothetical protein [Haloplanus salinarum]|uniref:hypothetical protein n=1 Tax=Haloplanus salinarum TaxID=1912324 RepID=UPI00214B1AC0|nr:hypothetical protein [Haloplanus salinarum]
MNGGTSSYVKSVRSESNENTEITVATKRVEECIETISLNFRSSTYAHEGVRKAVALARYARELRTWAADLHDRADAATGVDDWLLPDQRGRHKRESVPLVVPDRYTERFDQLRSYLADEMEAVDDESMQQEVELLETLCQQAPATPREVSD